MTRTRAAPITAPCLLSLTRTDWMAASEAPLLVHLPVATASALSLCLPRGATYAVSTVSTLPEGHGTSYVETRDPRTIRPSSTPLTDITALHVHYIGSQIENGTRPPWWGRNGAPSLFACALSVLMISFLPFALSPMRLARPNASIDFVVC